MGIIIFSAKKRKEGREEGKDNTNRNKMTDMLSDVLGACHCFGGTDGMSPWGDDLEVPQTRNDSSSGRRRGRGRSTTRRTRCINASSGNTNDSNELRDNSLIKMEQLQQQTSTSYWPLKNTMFRPPAADARASAKSMTAAEPKTRPSSSPHHATGRTRKKTRDYSSSRHGRRRHHAPWRNRRSFRRGSSLPAVSKVENNYTDEEEDDCNDDDRDSSPAFSTHLHDTDISLNDHEPVVRVSTSRSRSRSRTSVQRRFSKQRSNSIVQDSVRVPPSSIDVVTSADKIISVGTSRKKGVRRKSNGDGEDNESIMARQSISERLLRNFNLPRPRPFAGRNKVGR